ncbi:MAG: hypothetical protein LBP59_11635 [Planctomycetaceae bacterium]|jgi:hypothetical protein|nr:hypothetical protein [Planctomycetaceae bacterium]
MKKILVVILVGLCACLFSGCCCDSDTTDNQPTQNGPYLTLTMANAQNEKTLYITTRPIEPIEYTWVESDEYSDSGHYFGAYNISHSRVPHVTEWSDGSITFTVGAFENATYTHTETGEFTDNEFVVKPNAPIQYKNVRWVGTAPNGFTIADYNSYDAEVLFMVWIINLVGTGDTDYIATRGGYTLKNRTNNYDPNDDTENEITNNITTNDGLPAF